MTYLEQIGALFNTRDVTITRARIESYMCKVNEEGKWVVTIGTTPAATFTLVCMPGCCGIAISTACTVATPFRGKGLGTLLNRMRMQMAYELGYSVMLCTDVMNNTPQQLILRKNKWMRLLQFDNRRTYNSISLDWVPLSDTEQKLGFDVYAR